MANFFYTFLGWCQEAPKHFLSSWIRIQYHSIFSISRKTSHPKCKHNQSAEFQLKYILNYKKLSKCWILHSLSCISEPCARVALLFPIARILFTSADLSSLSLQLIQNFSSIKSGWLYVLSIAMQRNYPFLSSVLSSKSTHNNPLNKFSIVISFCVYTTLLWALTNAGLLYCALLFYADISFDSLNFASTSPNTSP